MKHPNVPSLVAPEIVAGPIATAGEVFSSGETIELIRQGTDAPLQLLLWDGQQARTGACLKWGDATYVPARIESTIASALRFPAGATPYGSSRKLFDEISSLLFNATHLPEAAVRLITFSIFASWLSDCLPVMPFLWIIAPPTIWREPLLQLLHLLYRRALVVSEPTLATLGLFAIQLKPTLVIEADRITPPLLKLLRASQRPGTHVVVGDKFLDVSCPKIVLAHEPLPDLATAGFPLEIVVPPFRQYMQRIDIAEAERVAAEFQSKLLMYRLVNYGKVTGPSFGLDQFTAPVQRLGLSLAASIVGDDELQSSIVPLLKERDQEIRVDRAELLDSIVLEVLLAACHKSPTGTLSMVELTKTVNTILAGRGETQTVTPERVGWRLRALGLRTGFIAGGRKGLPMLAQTRETIHLLAAAYGVRTLRQGATTKTCPACAALDSEQGEKAHKTGRSFA